LSRPPRRFSPRTRSLPTRRERADAARVRDVAPAQGVAVAAVAEDAAVAAVAADAVRATVCADVAMGQAVDAVAVRVPVLARARIRAEAAGPVRISRRRPTHRNRKLPQPAAVGSIPQPGRSLR
jgi:hypothetical protein